MAAGSVPGSWKAAGPQVGGDLTSSTVAILQACSDYISARLWLSLGLGQATLAPLFTEDFHLPCASFL